MIADCDSVVPIGREMGIKEEVFRQLREYFARRGDVAVAYVFGSFARDDARSVSDLDIGVLMERGIESATMWRLASEMSSELESLLGRHDVDLTILNGADSFFLHQVIKFGEVVFEKSVVERVEFEARSELEYLDFAPIRDMFSREMFMRIKEGRFGH